MRERVEPVIIDIAKSLVAEGKDSHAESILAALGAKMDIHALKRSMAEERKASRDHAEAAMIAKQFPSEDKLREAGERMIRDNLLMFPDQVMRDAKKFGISDEEARALVEKWCRELLEAGKPDRILSVARYIQISPQLLKEAQRADVSIAAGNNPVDAIQRAKKYGIPPDEMRDTAIKAIKLLLVPAPDDAMSIANDFNIPGNELSAFAIEKAEGLIGSGDFRAAANIGRKIPIERSQIELLKALLDILPR
jgi:hypothetical protein